MRRTCKRFLFLSAMVVVLGCSAGALAQVPTTIDPAPAPAPVPQQPTTPPVTDKVKAQKAVRPRPNVRQARVTMVKGQEPVAPQVVTVIHRLSGAEWLRAFTRMTGEGGTTVTITPDAVMNNVHASIIAGWVLEDGKTILARLPQAAAEMEVQRFSRVWSDKLEKLDKANKEDKSDKPDTEDEAAAAAHRRAPRAPRMQPDLTVMTQDGRTFRARYVGIDGQTGLSVLQFAGAASTAVSEVAAEKVLTGANVQLFAPERVADTAAYTIMVRIGKTEAKVAKIINPRSQMMDRMMLRGVKLSPIVIGGVACDESGRTLGIVDAIEGNNARLVTADAVRAAARRVLESQASVPRPLLGIRGEAVGAGARKTLLEFGWNEKQFEELLQKQIGILLTSVLPGTPAAFANLHPGDIIIRVDDKDIKSAEEFSSMLAKAGTGEEVQFVVQRPKAPVPLKLDVRLGGAYQPVFEWEYKMPITPRIQGGLRTIGVEAVALSIKSAPQWGASGLLVIAIEPESAAARAGLKEGDVIESIDGKVMGHGAWAYAYTFKRQEKHVLSVVRAKEKKQVVIGPVGVD